MKISLLIIAVVLGAFALGWIATGNEFFLTKTFAPKFEAVRRTTFEQSKAYNEGERKSFAARSWTTRALSRTRSARRLPRTRCTRLAATIRRSFRRICSLSCQRCPPRCPSEGATTSVLRCFVGRLR